MQVVFKVANPVETETQPTINSPRKPVLQDVIRPLEDVRSLNRGLVRPPAEDSYNQRRTVKQEASTMSAAGRTDDASVRRFGMMLIVLFVLAPHLVNGSHLV